MKRAVSAGQLLFVLPSLAALCLCLALCVGCQRSGSPAGEQDGHVHGEEEAHHHSQTYSEAVAKIKGLHEEIREAFAAGTPEEADDAVHEIGHLLDSLPHLASHEDFSGIAQTEIGSAADTAFDAYSELDMLIHAGGENVDLTYEDVAEQIDESIGELEAKAAQLGGEVAPEHGGEAHDEHEHEEGKAHEHEHEAEEQEGEDQQEHEQEVQDAAPEAVESEAVESEAVESEAVESEAVESEASEGEREQADKTQE